MKGVFADSQQLFGRILLNKVLPSHTYGICSGGLPEVIPELTREQLIRFHSDHYCPGNAKFYTYGDLPLEGHLDAVNDYISGAKQATGNPCFPYSSYFAGAGGQCNETQRVVAF